MIIQREFLMCLFLMGLFGCSSVKYKDIVIYYQPFSSETYLPITADDISCRYETKYVSNDKSKVSEVYKIIFSSNKAGVAFDRLSVRAKVIFDKEIIYIDSNGIFDYGGNVYKIDIDNFEKFIDGNALYIHRNLYHDPACKYPE